MIDSDAEYAGFKIGDFVVPLNESISWKYVGMPLWTEEIDNKTSCTPGMILSVKNVNKLRNVATGLARAFSATEVRIHGAEMDKTNSSFLFKVLLGDAIYHIWSFDLKKHEYETNHSA
jgi:hypothetical protein